MEKKFKKGNMVFLNNPNKSQKWLNGLYCVSGVKDEIVSLIAIDEEGNARIGELCTTTNNKNLTIIKNAVYKFK